MGSTAKASNSSSRRSLRDSHERYCCSFPKDLAAIIDPFAQIQGFKYVFVAGARILITATYRISGSIVPRKTIPGQPIVPCRTDVPLAR